MRLDGNCRSWTGFIVGVLTGAATRGYVYIMWETSTERWLGMQLVPKTLNGSGQPSPMFLPYSSSQVSSASSVLVSSLPSHTPVPKQTVVPIFDSVSATTVSYRMDAANLNAAPILDSVSSVAVSVFGADSVFKDPVMSPPNTRFHHRRRPHRPRPHPRPRDSDRVSIGSAKSSQFVALSTYAPDVVSSPEQGHHDLEGGNHEKGKHSRLQCLNFETTSKEACSDQSTFDDLYRNIPSKTGNNCKCACCKDAYPKPSIGEVPAKGSIGASHRAIRAAATNSFRKVLGQYERGTWHATVRTHDEMLQLRSVLAAASDGAPMMIRDILLTDGHVVARGYKILDGMDLPDGLPSPDPEENGDQVMFGGKSKFCASGNTPRVQNVDRYSLSGFFKGGDSSKWTGECRKACLFSKSCTHYMSGPNAPLRDCLLYEGNCEKGNDYIGQAVKTYKLNRKQGNLPEPVKLKLSALPAHCPTDLLSLFPKWVEALEELAMQRAVNGRVHFTLTDKTYKTVLPCWHRSIEMVTKNRGNTLIIPTDEETLSVCKSHALPCVVVGLPDLPRMRIYGDIGFLKFYAMAIISSLGLSFIFSEMDVLVLKDPWIYHEKDDGEQWAHGDCRHSGPAGRPISRNAPAEAALIQVTAHFNHPRVNIGYIYVRWSLDSMAFLLQLIAYYAGKCADKILGYNHKPGTYVDDGLPDQNIFDAFLRNLDHYNYKYKDVPWDVLPKVPWKLLDFNVFGIYGKAVKGDLVTIHYAGEGRKVPCWEGICKRTSESYQKSAEPECMRQWVGAPCKERDPDAPFTLQTALHETCLASKITCKR